NQLAHYLQSQAVGPDVLVGVCMERSIEMVVALLSILKAGGAYFPLDPSYPLERLAFMIEDAGLNLLLTNKLLSAALPPTTAEVVCLDRDCSDIAAHSEADPAAQSRPDDLAYVMYTSGSTGIPKGVSVP